MKPRTLEIRDPIHGPITAFRDEVVVIDSPYVQRLRGIKQMGFAELTFPGATHNRYSHSLGAFHLAGRVFDQALAQFPWKDAEEKSRFRSLIRMAALLHDSGHGPLSHAIEQAMPKRCEVLASAPKDSRQATHEDYTEAILLNSSLTEVLSKVYGDTTALAVTCLIRNDDRQPELFMAGEPRVSLFPILSSLISGEIDVDRMDYMLRDSLFSGIPYGHFDRDWLLSNLTYIEKGNKLYLALDSRALYAFEDFLLSRYHMYLMVYLHHKAIIYDEMLYQFLATDGGATKLPASVADYLDVDDYWLRVRLRQSKSSWAERIINQRPYKMLLELNSDRTEEARVYADELESKLKKAGISYFRASATGVISKYAGQSPSSTNQIYLLYRDRRFTSSRRPGVNEELLSEATELYGRYKNKRIIDRIYAERDLTS